MIPVKRLLLSLVLCASACTGRDPIPVEEPPVIQPPPAKPDPLVTRSCQRPGHAELERDPVVKWAFEQALYQGVVAARELNNEQGGWLYQCRRPAVGGGEEYYLDAVVEPSPNPKAGRSHIYLNDATYGAHGPVEMGGEQCRTVGNFHVHISHGSAGEKISDGDLYNAAERGLPAFMIKNRAPTNFPYNELPSWTPHQYGGWTDQGRERLVWKCECEDPPKGRKAEADESCAIQGERFFGRIAATIGTAEPRVLEAGPLEWPRDRSAELTRAIRADADLMAHVVAQSLGFEADGQSEAALTEMMEGAFRGPMNLVQKRERSLRGPFFGRREHDVVDRSAVSDSWDGGLVRQGLGFAHQATGAGSRIRGEIRSDTRARVYQRAERVRAFAIRYEGQTDGIVEPVNGVTPRGHLGSNGDGEGLSVLGVVVVAQSELTLRMTVRAEGSGDVAATAIVVPAVVLEGGALAAFPAAAPGKPGAQTVMASSAGQAGGAMGEVSRKLAELPPEQRQMLSQALGGDPAEAVASMLGQVGGTPDGRFRLPGPPSGRDQVLYYIMTVIQFNLESRSLPERRWSGSGVGSVAVRLEVNPESGSPVPELPGLHEIDRVLAPAPGPEPVGWFVPGRPIRVMALRPR